MTKIKSILLLLVCMGYSLFAFADNAKLLTCKDFKGFPGVKQKITAMDQTFKWDSSDCKIVGTTSLFPRKNKNDVMQFEKGLQIFVYDNYHLKFICVPGWICKAWDQNN